MKKITYFFLTAILFFSCSPEDTSPLDSSQPGLQVKKILISALKHSYTNLSTSNQDIKLPLQARFLENMLKKQILTDSQSRELAILLDNYRSAGKKFILQTFFLANEIIEKNIENLQINDPASLLNGDALYVPQDYDSLAICHYFEYANREQIYTQLKPLVEKQLNIDYGLGFSLNEAWNDLILFANENITDFQTLDCDLPEFFTNYILDQFFSQMGLYEKELRKQQLLDL